MVNKKIAHSRGSIALILFLLSALVAPPVGAQVPPVNGTAPILGAPSPTARTIGPGGNTSFNVSVTGNPVPALQWQRSIGGGGGLQGEVYPDLLQLGLHEFRCLLRGGVGRNRHKGPFSVEDSHARCGKKGCFHRALK